MAEDVTLPAIGKVKSEYVWAGIALVAGIAGYAWWKSRASAASAATSYVDPTAATDSGTGNYTNPNPSNANGDGNPDTGSAPTTDQEWTQLALTTVTWLEPGYLAGVLGAYLSRTPLSIDDAATVKTVWGIIGKPPGNEPIILITSGGGSPGGTVTPPTQTPVPPVLGTPAPNLPRPARQYVTVVKFTTHNPPWNSTLSGIAGHYSTTVGHLMSLNPDITNPNLIHVGQRVYVT